MAVRAKQIREVSRLPELVIEEFGGREYAYVPLIDSSLAKSVCATIAI